MAVQSLLRGLVALGGVPEMVWSDAYALGWLSGYALGWAYFQSLGYQRSKRRVNRHDRDGPAVLRYVLEQVEQKERSIEILQRVSHLEESNDPEFRRGLDAAMKTAFYGAGGDLDPNDPDHQAAKNLTEALAKAGAYAAADRSAITGNLVAHLFYNVVQANRA